MHLPGVVLLALAELAPDRADAFRDRTATLASALHTLHVELAGTLATIPQKQRTLVTSEAAFL